MYLRLHVKRFLLRVKNRPERYVANSEMFSNFPFVFFSSLYQKKLETFFFISVGVQIRPALSTVAIFHTFIPSRF